MNQKLVKIILEELEGGKRKRWELTDRLRNYPRAEKVEAIKHCTTAGLVSLAEEKVDGAGRNPVYVSITSDGLKELKRLKDVIPSFGIWSA